MYGTTHLDRLTILCADFYMTCFGFLQYYWEKRRVRCKSVSSGLNLVRVSQVGPPWIFERFLKALKFNFVEEIGLLFCSMVGGSKIRKKRLWLFTHDCGRELFSLFFLMFWMMYHSGQLGLNHVYCKITLECSTAMNSHSDWMEKTLRK